MQLIITLWFWYHLYRWFYYYYHQRLLYAGYVLRVLFLNEYKYLVKIWVYTFVIWYSIICFSLYDVTPIIIGPGHTKELIQKIIHKDLFFDSLCFQTIYLFNDLSTLLNCNIHVPIFNVLSLFFITSTSCSGKGRTSLPKPSPKSDDSSSPCWFGSLPSFSKKATKTWPPFSSGNFDCSMRGLTFEEKNLKDSAINQHKNSKS